MQAKVLETLTYLIQHRDRAAGSDELMSAVWGRVDVSDNVLSVIAFRARRTVGDDGKVQHSIRTVLHFGFRWVRALEVAAGDALLGDVEALTDGRSPDAPPLSALAPERSRWNRRRALAVASAVLFVGVVGWGVSDVRALTSRAPARSARVT